MLLFTDSPSRLFWGGGFLGAISSVAALIVSYWFDWPPGSSIVLVLGAVFVIAFVASPRYGLASKWRRRHVHDVSSS